MRPALVLCQALLAVALTAAAALAQCPSLSGTCFAPTTEPAASGYCQPRFSGPLSQQCDLRRGTLEVTGHGSGSYPGFSTLLVADDFVLGGIVDEDTVRCRLVVEIRGQLGCASGGFAGVACSARDSEGTTVEYVERIESSAATPSPYLPLEELFTLDLAWTPDTSHRLHVELAVSGSSGGGSAAARYWFVGLPPGATLRSCHGFVNELPTPVKRASWGSLRTRYR